MSFGRHYTGKSIFFNKLTKDIDISLDKEERKDANTGTNNDRTSS